MKLYTIGHSTHSSEEFLKLLKKHNINCIVDVRSVPKSKYTSQFNYEELKKKDSILKSNNIYYVPMGKEFGARRLNRNLYADGYLDFEKVKQTKEFQSGVKRILNGLNKNLNIAFMCTEKNPIDCHRNILVAKYFHDNSYNILNINADGSITTQEEINNQLLDMYFEDRDQISMFPEENKSESELLKEAYKRRNAEIAYKIDDEKGVAEDEVIYDRFY